MSSLTPPENLQPYQQQVLAGLYQISQRQANLDETVSAVQTDAGTLKADVNTLKDDISTLKANIDKIEYKLDMSQRSSGQVVSLAKTIVFAVVIVALLSPILQALTPTITDFVNQLISDFMNSDLLNQASDMDIPAS